MQALGSLALVTASAVTSSLLVVLSLATTDPPQRPLM